jgi:23S rRNA pseudouridine1911/1915/1917 synthase
VEFIHPVSKEPICIEAPVPEDPLWEALSTEKSNKS